MKNQHPVKPRHRRRQKQRRIPLWIWGLLLLTGLGGVVYGVDYAMSEGQLPRGVTVGGVEIGGMSPNQAEQRLRNELGESVRKPVTIEAGTLTSVIEPTQSGLQVNWPGTVDQAGQQPLNPITRLTSFWKKREVGIVSSFNDANLDRSILRVERELDRPAENAALAVDDRGKADIKNDIPGQHVDRAVLREGIERQWLNKTRTVKVDADVINAAIRVDAAKALAKDIVEPATSGPLTFKGRDNVTAEIRPEDMGKILTFPEEGDTLRVDWNMDAAKDILQPQLASTEVEFRNANFRISGNDVTVIPHSDGVSIKWDQTLEDFQGKALNKKEREHEVFYEDKKATYTTEQAKNARFDDVMGEFTTGGFSSASGVNIRRVAEMVDGAIVLPGETFSLNGHTGPRGEAQGFVKSGIILNGKADEAVGGGISQFATTLYNASYFAGMDDVAHKPHSYYISRYPEGREATVYEGAIDLKFKNPFNTPARIVATTTSNSVTVKLMGVKHVNVESITGPRTNPTQPQVRQGSGDKCIPSSGAPGFTVTDTRVVKDLSGKELRRNTTTTKYDPNPIVRCGGGGRGDAGAGAGGGAAGGGAGGARDDAPAPGGAGGGALAVPDLRDLGL
ncbi:hypothetical protein F7230_06445 [Corynebacterium sp. 320]|uniref:VanW family protein n=2 Tax=Corynebacterium TaxID=1716 RepID=UPI00125CCF8A|nr:hypothetical protein F7230_06445 [Corynebacterium sp. 320]KAB1550617.1 hypothetical protein F7233_08740 [Corynebacterium sp. 321]KAB1550978.1 hypothetical protein F7232_07920 [Corynebacterium sp. 319]KAB3526967.1 hypothetical protein F8354_06445 [Corynebacterium sp. 250]KAB3538459.1 hypothetical protein F8390_09345 [Corynebacterium sp. 366]QNP92420.1 VanW family protein [Corynebacterium zhongnanshanii]